MESTGIKNKIHVSKTTFDLLVQAGKAHCLRPRTDTVDAKGKGVLQTYWLSPSAKKASSASASSTSDGLSSDQTGSIVQHEDAPPYSNVRNLKPSLSDVNMTRDRLVDW